MPCGTPVCTARMVLMRLSKHTAACLSDRKLCVHLRIGSGIPLSLRTVSPMPRQSLLYWRVLPRLREDVDCPCGAPHQTRAHILQDCPLYEEHRSLLRDVAPAMDLNTILSTKDGIAALAKC